MGIGVCLITKSNLGTSPISSIALVLSFIFPVSLGQFTFLISMIFLLIEIFILGKKCKPVIGLQIFIGPLFGFFIDLSMNVFRNIRPDSYINQLSILLLGCVVLSLGVFCQIQANLIMNPGEGLVKAISEKRNLKFGTVKSLFDSILVLTAMIISCVFLHSIQGIREGTIISAIIVGCITKLIYRFYLFLRHFFCHKDSF